MCAGTVVAAHPGEPEPQVMMFIFAPSRCHKEQK